jgi:hypothetical protein
MPDNIVAVADSTTGTVRLTLYFPAPTGAPVHVFRVHPDGTEYEVLGSPVVMSDGYAVLFDNAAPMDVPVFYHAYTSGGLVAYDAFSRVVVDHWNPGVLNLPGGAGNYASTPDAASLDIVGDIELRAEVSLDSWTPATEQTLVSKWNTTGNQRSYKLSVLPSGALRMAWSTNGTAVTQADSTVVTGFQPDLARFIRATLDVSSGEVRFYTSDHGGGWLQLGDPVVVGATSIFASTATVGVGAISAGAADVATAQVYAAQIRDGIAGTIVADPKFKEYGPTVTSFNDSTGKTWTLNGTAAIVEHPINLDWDLTSGAAAEFDVNGTVGQQTPSAANLMRHSIVDVGLTDVRVEGTASISQDPVTGAAATARVWARASSASDYYEANLNFNTSDTVTLILGKRVAGVFTTLAGPTTIASSFAVNEKFRIALETEGPEVRAKAWAVASQTEPATWQLATSDLSLTTGTLVALASRREGGNTNAGLIFSWDDFVAYGPAAEPPASTLRYNFVQDVQGWVGEGATTVDWVSEPAFSTPGALRATKTMGAGFDSLRFNDNDQLPANLLPWGNTFYGWVMVPEDAAGTNWLGRLEVQDSTFTYQGGQDVSLVPGLWIPLSFTGPTSVLENAHAVGVQVGATGVNGVQSVYFDSLFQTFDAMSNYVLLDTAPDGWLKSPTMPWLDIRLDNCEVHSPSCLDGEQEVFFKALDAEEFASASGVFDIVDKARPAVVGQTRKDIRTNLILISRRLSDITAIKKLLSFGTPLILNLPAIYGWGLETFGQDWIQVGDDAASRLGSDMRKPYRTWSLPLVVVDHSIAFPSGGTGGNGIGVAGATWGDLAASGQTWGQHSATGNWWIDTAQGDNY